MTRAPAGHAAGAVGRACACVLGTIIPCSCGRRMAMPSHLDPLSSLQGSIYACAISCGARIAEHAWCLAGTQPQRCAWWMRRATLSSGAWAPWTPGRRRARPSRRARCLASVLLSIDGSIMRPFRGIHSGRIGMPINWGSLITSSIVTNISKHLELLRLAVLKASGAAGGGGVRGARAVQQRAPGRGQALLGNAARPAAALHHRRWPGGGRLACYGALHLC